MKLTDLLSGKRPAVLKRWLDVTVETYPSGAPIFLKKQKSRFSNPVVYTVSQGIELILDELLQETDFDKISPFLDSIIRIKAVQGLPPSQAIAFVFKLKNVIREAVGSDAPETLVSEELAALDSKIDALALLAFDNYMKCREKIYELKANEVRNMTYRLLQRAELICEVQDQETGLNDNNIDNVK